MRVSSVTTHHLAYLDGLRAIAALWVVMHHCWYLVSDQLSPTARTLTTPLIYGREMVDLFIVLSGFCLMLPVVKAGGFLPGGAIEFFKRRAWRILPTYYFACAFSLILIALFIHQDTGQLWDKSLPVTPKNILTHLLLLHDVFKDDFKINYVFWSIAVEWRIYFFFPLFVLGWRYFGPVKTTLFAYVTGAVLCFVLIRLIGSTLTMTYLGLFANGMFGAAIAFSDSDFFRRLHKLPWHWITLLCIVLVFVLYHLSFTSLGVRDNGVGLLAVSVVIQASVNRNSWLHAALSFRPLAFIGTFAYSIYLIHAPLLQILWQYFLVPLHPHPLRMLSALLLLGVPAIVGAAYLFFLCFERPFLRLRKKTMIPVPAPA